MNDTSPEYSRDLSVGAVEHASSGARANASAGPGGGSVAPSSSRRLCAWCRSVLEDTARVDAVFCGRKCRQTAWRLGRRRATDAVAERPIQVAYADPPYPGLAAKYYRHEPTFAGEVDHVALVARLVADFPDGWALSTSARALRDLLPLCPPSVRVCAWTKPHPAPAATAGLHNVWEPLLVVGGRQRRPGVRDALFAQAARFGGQLPGRKPIAFAAWLFDCLGLGPGDALVDLFPGTGAIGRAWSELSRRSSATGRLTSPEASGDVSRPGADDGQRAAR